MTNWQPIGTAPKDGTWFLGYGPDADWEEWDDDTMPKVGPVHFATEEYEVWDRTDPSTQKLRHTEIVGYWFPFEPTHWMPIPKPPEAQ